ncbi:MAG TPA: beta-ketoacyl-ACP synthase II, partial [Thermomicrobiales bacterium]|nr:beta-ketoacyl-ACP synthase II [Thermomicrobiales bacterium]
MSSQRRRVVITGMGAVTPLGNDAGETWRALLAGRSGIGEITRFDAEGFATRFAGEVKGFKPEERLGRKESRRMDRYSQYAVVASLEAAEASGLTLGDEDGTRAAVIMGTAIGGLETVERGTETLMQSGPRHLSPFLIPMMLPNMAAGNVAIALGARGSNFAPTSACASAAHAIGEGMHLIRRGDADVVIAGGAEAPITKLSVGGFNAMGALSTRNDDPERASRPFDAERDGFVLAEGAGVLVLEALERATARGATIIGELMGYGSTDDANHIVQPAPGGEGAVRAMQMALTDADLAPAQIDYINAHGTSTQLNEKLETTAIKTVFGEHAHDIPISSTKSMTGHLLGAAGGVEAVFSLMALREGWVPPTINFQVHDPNC